MNGTNVEVPAIRFTSSFVNTWQVSRLMPKPAGGVEEAACVGLNQGEAEWTERYGDREGFFNLHSFFGDQDGLVYLARRFDVTVAGEWALALGHDGGVRLFVDGQCIFTEPKLLNPAKPGRSRVCMPLTSGEHEIVVAFDLASGLGWGIFSQIQALQRVIILRRELYAKAPDQQTSEWRSQRYVNGTGLLKRVERRHLQRESDFACGASERYSDDNGRTWGEWRDVYGQSYEVKDKDEINTEYGNEVFNPRYGHFVSVGYQRIFLEGHTKAYARYWGSGEAGCVDHCLMVVREDGSDERAVDLIKYEDGADYAPDHWSDPAYIDHNRGICGNGVDVLANGEIIFPIEADVSACCRILGLDINAVFPSCPDIMSGLLVVRGKFNKIRGNYDLTFSRPIVITDLKSSRGVNEPTAVMLPSGRILAVFRGSNVMSANWRTRIEPGTPAHKWFCYSDDGGRTFTDPVPWHFDDREIFYSSATCSTLLRSHKNGKIYWIGNITDHRAFGNDPRYPLVIAEVNDRGLLVKETLTTIDTRQEGDGEQLQLSNFSILQDRETGLLELYLTKLGQRKGFTWWADSWRYFIDVEGHLGCAK